MKAAKHPAPRLVRIVATIEVDPALLSAEEVAGLARSPEWLHWCIDNGTIVSTGAFVETVPS